MQKYADYVTSQATWLGRLPTHWDCKKIGALFSERKVKVSDKDYAPLSVAKIGVVPQLETAVKTDAGDIKAVQTLSRLNRCCPKKYDTFVLDFANKPEMIQESFSRYYRTTILSGETDPNKLYDLVAIMDEYQIFTNEDVERLVNLYLDGADRDKLDQTLDACTAIYKQLDTDDQIKFKSAAKSFVRTYGFLGAILPYGNADWERLSIFLNLLIPKLPSPREDDLSQGILETIDLESYRNEAREVMSIKLEDSDTEVDPVPAGKVGHIVEPEMDLLSVILSNFNDMFGNISWNDADNVRRQILEIPAMVSRDEKYQNAMKNSDEQSARLESERALQQVIFAIMADNMELFKQFQDNPSFKKWLSDLVFNLTYNKDGKPYEPPQQEHNQGNQDTAQQPYDMTADGFSLDDKRSPVADNDIPDIIARFRNPEAEKDRQRTEKSFFVPMAEIVGNGYDLSINNTKRRSISPWSTRPPARLWRSCMNWKCRSLKVSPNWRGCCNGQNRRCIFFNSQRCKYQAGTG